MAEFEGTQLDELFGETVAEEGFEKPSPQSEPEETPSEEPKAEPEVKDEVKEEPTEAPPEEKAEPEEEQPSTNWEQRYWETQRYVGSQGQKLDNVTRENQELKRQLEIINKKLDGEWDDATAKEYEEKSRPPVEQIEADANIQGRIEASKKAAIEIYGEQKVIDTIYADNAPFRAIENDPVVRAKVLGSDTPVIEAMKLVEVKQFHDKFGYDPKDIRENVRKEFEQELRKEITKDIQEKLKAKGQLPKGIEGVRESESQRSPDWRPARTDELFSA